MFFILKDLFNIIYERLAIRIILFNHTETGLEGSLVYLYIFFCSLFVVHVHDIVAINEKLLSLLKKKIKKKERQKNENK